MKTISLILASFLLVASVHSQTNESLSEDAHAIYSRVDKRLNEVYQKLLAKYKSDVVFIKNLKSSQRLWIQFRNAQLTLKYPKHGSVDKKTLLPMGQAIYLAHLTEERTKLLLEWLTIPTIGLVAHYSFNGNPYDESCNGYDADVIRATVTTSRLGLEIGAYSFNGINSVIQCGDILDEVFCAPIAKFSVAGWARTRRCGSFEHGGGFMIGKNGGGTYGPYQWNVTHADGFVYAAVFSDTAARNYVALTSPMSTNQWFQFVLVFDGSLPEMQRVRLYVDGQSSNTSVYQHVGRLGTTTSNSRQHLTIGASHEANYPQLFQSFYDGDIDDIRIYDRALTTTEIQELYFSQ